MKKYLPILILFIGLINVRTVSAATQTRVSISNTGEGAISKVEVKNSFKSSSSTVSNSDSITRIRIETNGEVKEYNSDKPEDIKLESSDGSASVHVDTSNNSSSNNNLTITPPSSPTTAKQIEEKKAEIEKKIDAKKEEIKKKLEAQKAKIEEKGFGIQELFKLIFSFSWF